MSNGDAVSFIPMKPGPFLQRFPVCFKWNRWYSESTEEFIFAILSSR